MEYSPQEEWPSNVPKKTWSKREPRDIITGNWDDGEEEEKEEVKILVVFLLEEGREREGEKDFLAKVVT